MCIHSYIKKVKWSRYMPGLAQTVGRGIALLFNDSGTRSGWLVSSTPRPHFPSGNKLYPFYRRLSVPQCVWLSAAPKPINHDNKPLHTYFFEKQNSSLFRFNIWSWPSPHFLYIEAKFEPLKKQDKNDQHQSKPSVSKEGRLHHFWRQKELRNLEGLKVIPAFEK